jgi:hypothetical protein
MGLARVELDKGPGGRRGLTRGFLPPAQHLAVLPDHAAVLGTGGQRGSLRLTVADLDLVTATVPNLDAAIIAIAVAVAGPATVGIDAATEQHDIGFGSLPVGPKFGRRATRQQDRP